MQKNKYFYQDYLMDFPYDNNEFPLVTINYINTLEYAQEFDIPFNLFDLPGKYYRYLSFQFLHDQKEKEKWEELFKQVKKLDGVIIVDDINIWNKEVYSMKEFYLKVYYWNIKQYNQNVFVFKN